MATGSLLVYKDLVDAPLGDYHVLSSFFSSTSSSFPPSPLPSSPPFFFLVDYGMSVQMSHACAVASICRSQNKTPVVSLCLFLLHPLELGSPSESWT